MPDRFSDHAPALQSPASHGFSVVPNDIADLTEVTRALYVGASGSVAVTLASGAEIAFAGVAGGTVLPVRVRRVKAAGTTATALVGLV
jgi:hypothetical protein